MNEKEIKSRLDGIMGADAPHEAADEGENTGDSPGENTENKQGAKGAIAINLISAGILAIISFLLSLMGL